jgi:PAS domain S-box-containing protein
MHDITRRKAVEEALRLVNESFAALVKASPLPILAFDRNRQIRRWNPAAARAFGWDEQEVLGRTNPLIPPDREEEYESLVARILAGEELSAIETARQRKDGTRVDVNLWMSPLRDAEGQVHGVMVMIADITERKRAEAELRRHHEEQAALFGITAAVATTLDRDELLSTVLDAVLPALAADAIWIALPSAAAGDRLDVVASRGTPELLAAGETTVTVQDCVVY